MGRIYKETIGGDFTPEEIVSILKGTQLDIIIRREVESLLREIRKDFMTKEKETETDPVVSDKLTRTERVALAHWCTMQGRTNGSVNLKDIAQHTKEKYPHWRPKNYGQAIYSFGQSLLKDKAWKKGKKGSGLLVYKEIK